LRSDYFLIDGINQGYCPPGSSGSLSLFSFN